MTTLLDRLKQGENVQNRQLRTLLGDDGFAQFESEWLEQVELREVLRNKPAEVVEYERRLKQAIFTYNKADAASRQGRRKAARDLFAVSDTQFERVAEYLNEHIAWQFELAAWFDRDVNFDATNAPSGSADNFPCVVTSRSTRNLGGGYLKLKRTKHQVKIDAVERELDKLQGGVADESEIARRLAFGRKLRARFDD